MHTAVALIPARAGSRRVPDKNVRRLGAHPLIAYSIAAAGASGVFARVVVSTDDARYAEIARHYGAETPFLRPAAMAASGSPDIDWVTHALGALSAEGTAFDAFALLRPTSPFRTAATIQRAWRAFTADTAADSLRAIEPCAQHPGKMWIVRGDRMHPLLPCGPADPPWHSRPLQTLPPVYVQNASLEFAWRRVVDDTRTIAGEMIVPFETQGVEGFDINTEDDWHLASWYVEGGRATLPAVDAPPWTDGDRR